MSGSKDNFDAGILKSILCLSFFPDEIVNVGGNKVSIGPPPSFSSSGIASDPSISTHKRPPEFDHWPVIKPTPVAFPSSISRLI